MAGSDLGSTSSPTKGSIRALDAPSVHRMTSGQVVVDLQTAVKELVENSLDAKATNIDIRFKDYGLTSFEVVDNGSGISEQDYESIALNHHTSKLDSFEGLSHVKTFGFRGEALSSLCSLGKVIVQTADAKSAPKGHELVFDHQGRLVSKKVFSRQKGTTVLVSSLFHNLPVRRKQFENDHKKHFAACQTLLQAYALIETGVRITSSNQTGKKPKVVQFQTRGNPQLKHNLSDVFGSKVLLTVVELDLRLKVEPDQAVLRIAGRWKPKRTNNKGKGKARDEDSDEQISEVEADDGNDDLVTEVHVVGMVSKPVHTQGRTSSDRQFFFVNGRPFVPSKVSKCFNDVYRTFNPQQYPIVVADFRLPTDAYDVNVEPNKRTVFLHREQQLIDTLRVALDAAFQPFRSTFPITQIGLIKPTPSSASQLPVVTYPHEPPPDPPARKRKVPVAEPPADDLEEVAAESGPDQAAESKRPRLEEMDTDEFFADEPAVDASVSGTYTAIPPLFAPDLDASEETGADDDHHPETMDADPVLVEHGSAGLTHDAQNALSPSSPTATFLPSPSRATSPSEPVSAPRNRPVQTTLDTSNLSWNLQKGPANGRRNGKAKPGPAAKKSGLVKLKSRLRGFASGSQANPQAFTSDSEEEEEASEDENEEGAAMEGDPEDEAPPEVDHELEDAVGAESDPIAPPRKRDRTRGQGIDFSSASPASLPPSTSPTTDGPTSEPDLREERQQNLRSLATEADSDAGPSGMPSGAGERRWRDEIKDAQIYGEVPLAISVDAITAAWTRNRRRRLPPSSPTKSLPADGLEEAGLQKSEAEAEAALSRSVDKADFARMEVVGQFNLGFIIARKRSGVFGTQGKRRATASESITHDDLFIVDQHASDEKYNFERLQKESTLQQQMLLHSRPLDLPAAEELVAMENLDILAANGFGVAVDEEAPVGRRVKLVAQPVSGNTTWGVADLEELLHLIQEAAPSSIPRPSKTRKHFAMRACRTSVMIGTSLSVTQMRSILAHMGTMNQPWACPHGRPTMRWLANCDTDSIREDLRHWVPNLGQLLALVDA